MILTGFQLRAARKALSLTLEQLGECCELTKPQLIRLEKTPNLEHIKCYNKDFRKLYNFFTENHLVFHNLNTISLNLPIEIRPLENNITRFQFVVSRRILNISQEKIAKLINLSQDSISYFEKKDNLCYYHCNKASSESIINIFQKFGISYLDNLSVKIN